MHVCVCSCVSCVFHVCVCVCVCVRDVHVCVCVPFLVFLSMYACMPLYQSACDSLLFVCLSAFLSDFVCMLFSIWLSGYLAISCYPSSTVSHVYIGGVVATRWCSGLMRMNEIDLVKKSLDAIDFDNLHVEDASALFLEVCALRQQ
jgi:hypothetical protein